MRPFPSAAWATALVIAGAGLMLPSQASADAAQDEMLETFQIYVIQKMGRHEEAFALWMKLAEKGNRQGILNVARMYRDGMGVQADPAKALEWSLRGAELGDADAMFEAASSLRDGIGAPADPVRAEELMRRAADSGSREAQTALAVELEKSGRRDEARALLEKASDAGDPDADAMLARLDGNGGPETMEAPAPAQDIAVREMLKAMDAAAGARDADAMLKPLADDAKIVVSLPGMPRDGSDMSAEDYRSLWKLTFSNAEGYSFKREAVTLTRTGEDVMALSDIAERFTRPGEPENDLRLTEVLTIRVQNGEPVIRGVKLTATPDKAPGATATE